MVLFFIVFVDSQDNVNLGEKKGRVGCTLLTSMDTLSQHGVIASASSSRHQLQHPDCCSFSGAAFWLVMLMVWRCALNSGVAALLLSMNFREIKR